MCKFNKYVFLALACLTISCLSSSIYAAKGGIPGAQGGKGSGPKVSIPAGKGKGAAKMPVTAGKSMVSPAAPVKFTSGNRETIINYFTANPVKVKTLPPGIVRRLLVGKPLPPGIEKQYIPRHLNALLPNYPNYNYLVVGDDVVLVNSITGIVADILRGGIR